MSSREIAELTGKAHAHVMRDIRAMLEQVGEGQSKFGSAYEDAQGKTRECYNLPRDLTYTLITGYRADLRHKIITRWMELETAVLQPPVPAIPQTYAAALMEAGRLALENEALTVASHAFKESHRFRFCMIEQNSPSPPSPMAIASGACPYD